MNDFGQTDYVIDLYNEIEKAYLELPSIFDKFSGGADFIIAFFPCVRFEQQILLQFRGEASQDKNKTTKQKLNQDLKLHKELSANYELITKLVIVCINKNIPLVIENPYNEQHYLKRYWCLKPKVIDTNRKLNGDSFKKPTQFWFVNCEPQNNFIFEPLKQVEIKKVDDCNTVERSMIQPQYANRFIREYIINEKEVMNNEI